VGAHFANPCVEPRNRALAVARLMHFAAGDSHAES
jgi:hypothetical protein